MASSDRLQALAHQAQRGDQAAFEALFDSCRELVRAGIESRLRAYGTQGLDVEDILQETFSQALGSLGRFRWEGEAAFLRWLHGISRNLTLAASRQAQRARPFEGAELEQLVDRDGAPSTGMRREERFARLEHALARLSAEHRQVILLSRIDGLTTAEIARRMERSHAAVRQLLWRALRALKENFGEETESLHLPARPLGPAPGERGVEDGGNAADGR
jgi:RNA polymerase sigma-70 factor (ECF subfamily)